MQTRRHVTRFVTLFKRREGHLAAINRRTVESDERLVSVARARIQVAQVGREGVAGTRARNLRVGAARRGSPLEALRRNGHVIRIRNGGVQRGRGLRNRISGVGGHRRIDNRRSSGRFPDGDVIQDDAIAPVRQAREGKLIGSRRVRQRQRVHRPNTYGSKILHQLLPLTGRRRAVIDRQVIQVTTPVFHRVPIADIRVGNIAEVEDGGDQTGGDPVVAGLVERGIVAAAVRRRDAVAGGCSRTELPVRHANDMLLRPTIGHETAILEILRVREGDDGIARCCKIYNSPH